MPTVLIIGNRRYFFRAADCAKNLAHIHCTEGTRQAVFGFRPIQVLRAGRFKTHELEEIEREIQQHLSLIEEKLDRFCKP
jgi:hypothetical protein